MVVWSWEREIILFMRYPDQNSVGIVSTGMYLPERVVTAGDITVESGIEERVIREKFGVIVTEGIGYVWGAACVRWSPTEA